MGNDENPTEESICSPADEIEKKVIENDTIDKALLFS